MQLAAAAPPPSEPRYARGSRPPEGRAQAAPRTTPTPPGQHPPLSRAPRVTVRSRRDSYRRSRRGAVPHRTMNANAGIRPAPIPHPAREGGPGLRPPLGSPAAALRRARPPLSDLGRAPEQIFTQGTKVVIPPARSLSNLSSNLSSNHAAAGGVALLEGGLMIGGLNCERLRCTQNSRRCC